MRKTWSSESLRPGSRVLQGLNMQFKRHRHRLALGPNRCRGGPRYLRLDVTDADDPFPAISQAFCSALPVAYSGVPAANSEAFGVVVLEAA
jgi:hypothetical protein